jgi:hypothetical protein
MIFVKYSHQKQINQEQVRNTASLKNRCITCSSYQIYLQKLEWILKLCIHFIVQIISLKSVLYDIVLYFVVLILACFIFSLKIISLEDYLNDIAKATDKTSEQKSSSLLPFYLQLLQAIILMTVVAR